MSTTFYFDLTAHELEEFNQLRKKLFGDNKFVIFTKEEEESEEYKRYDYLLTKKMNYIKNVLKKK
jgi:hypothetical protein